MKFKFKKDLEPQGTDDFWYDLTKGGYIKPEDFISDEKQVKALQDALALLEAFEEQLEDKELIYYN